MTADGPRQTPNGIEMINMEQVQQQLKAIVTAHGDYAKMSFEQTKTYAEKLSAVKSPDKAVELHTEYMKSAYETFVSEATKIGDLYKGFAKEAFAPMASFLQIPKFPFAQ